MDTKPSEAGVNSELHSCCKLKVARVQSLIEVVK